MQEASQQRLNLGEAQKVTGHIVVAGAEPRLLDIGGPVQTQALAGSPSKQMPNILSSPKHKTEAGAPREESIIP